MVISYLLSIEYKFFSAKVRRTKYLAKFGQIFINNYLKCTENLGDDDKNDKMMRAGVEKQKCHVCARRAHTADTSSGQNKHRKGKKNGNSVRKPSEWKIGLRESHGGEPVSKNRDGDCFCRFLLVFCGGRIGLFYFLGCSSRNS